MVHNRVSRGQARGRWALMTSGALSACLLFTVAPAPAQQESQAQQEKAGVGARVDARQVIGQWPEPSKKAANNMIEKYGQPNGVTETMLVWNNNGPWKQTTVRKEPIQHDFPMPHKDVLEQAINYKVPAEKFDDLAQFDGSVMAERTKGELSARCDSEAANFLAVNLAHKIVTDEMDVESARKEYAKQIKAMKSNEPAPLTEKLAFNKPAGETGDPGEVAEIFQGGGTQKEPAAGGKESPEGAKE